MKLILLFLMFFSLHLKSQTFIFSPIVKAVYTAKLTLGENYTKVQKFILVANTDSYYFAGESNFNNDTDYEDKTSKSNMQLTKADFFRERIVKSNDTFNVFNRIIDENLQYTEKANIKWVLYNDTKIVNGVKCQLAATNKYGRRWIAWFSSDYEISAGPYKFYGLPGLIFEIYDTRDDYHFTLEQLDKTNTKFDVNFGNYKLYSKKDYLKASYNLQFTPSGMPPMEGAMRKEFDDMLTRRKARYNNPIELKPFE